MIYVIEQEELAIRELRGQFKRVLSKNKKGREFYASPVFKENKFNTHEGLDFVTLDDGTKVWYKATQPFYFTRQYIVLYQINKTRITNED